MQTVTLTPHFLYFLWNAAGELLYVGETDNLARRFAEHQRDKRKISWWHEVARQTFQTYDSRMLAKMAESDAIATMNPRYNERGKTVRSNLSAAHPVEWNGQTYRWSRDARWARFFDAAGVKWLYGEYGTYEAPSFGLFVLKCTHRKPHIFIPANKEKSSFELPDLKLAVYRAAFIEICSLIPALAQPQSCLVGVSSHNRYRPPMLYQFTIPIRTDSVPQQVMFNGCMCDGTFETIYEPHTPDGSVVLKPYDEGQETWATIAKAYDEASQALKPADGPPTWSEDAIDWPATMQHAFDRWYSAPASDVEDEWEDF